MGKTTSEPSFSNPILRPLQPVQDAVIEASDLTKVYGRGSNQVTALDHVDVQIERGRFTAIMGPSGSGKSTLMHCLAGLDRATGGKIMLDDIEVTSMSQSRLTKLRRDRIGFIFQSFNLIPTLSAEENITLPADVAHRKLDPERFNTVVDQMGLRERLAHRPAELSGGQQQRVACARALVGEPAVVFADEPTGNLDSTSTRQVLDRLRGAVDSFGQTVVMVTHEPDAAAYADRVLFLVDGKVVAQLDDPNPDSVLDALRELNSAEAKADSSAKSEPGRQAAPADSTPPSRESAGSSPATPALVEKEDAQVQPEEPQQVPTAPVRHGSHVSSRGFDAPPEPTPPSGEIPLVFPPRARRKNK